MSGEIASIASIVGTGAAIRDPEAAVRAGFREDHMVMPYRLVFRACIELKESARTPASVAARAKMPMHEVKAVFSECVGVDDGLDLPLYARHLAAHHTETTARRLVKAMARDAEAADVDIVDYLPGYIADLNAVLTDTSDGYDATAVMVAAVNLLQENKTTATPTGLPSLDRIIGGNAPGNLVVVAARPGMGKTAFALQLAISSPDRASFIGLEDPKEELGVRLVCNLSGVANVNLRPPISDENWSKITSVTPPGHLNFVECVQPTLATVLSHVRREAARGSKLVLVDYLNLIQPPDADRHDIAIGKITASLKNAAKELKIVIVLMAQLNRELEKRKDKKPKLSDLRDSGNIEQDADRIIFLYRPALYDAKKDPEYCEVIVAKNRHGPCGTAAVRAELQYSRFTDINRTLKGGDDL